MWLVLTLIISFSFSIAICFDNNILSDKSSMTLITRSGLEVSALVGWVLFPVPGWVDVGPHSPVAHLLLRRTLLADSPSAPGGPGLEADGHTTVCNNDRDTSHSTRQ